MWHYVRCLWPILLFHCGTAEAVLELLNNESNYLVGSDINLTISYNSTGGIKWLKNNVVVAQWPGASGAGAVATEYKYLSIFGNGSLRISNATVDYSALYKVSLSALGEEEETVSLQVNIFEPVENVIINASSDKVSEGSDAVNLTCSSSRGKGDVSWKKDGKALDSSYNFTLLNENKTLRLNAPNRTYSGIYICKISNPVSSGEGNWTLIADQQSSLSPGAIAGIVVGSVCGALLLIALLILLICCLRQKKRKKEKDPALYHKDVLRTVSGTTLSPDDPAFFTRNNIMYRTSSISMGSYIFPEGDYTSDGKSLPSYPPSSPPRLKHATQV
ncbi:hepatocyte cell adhesion molecule [Bombina bombina]|uniref:hepatocyte cell adhesion molecule n=1 Tax=Bombina bombina TaxID=8345 RepID=UPI00235B1E9F|nr:hepatocyte cell adhesion molecule [Bombina bombina]